MKRFLGFAVAMFFALVAIALVGGDAGAVAGHGCHGARKCHGGLLAKLHSKRCHGERGHGRHHRRRCHGQAAPAACETGCGEAVASGCDSGACGGEVVEGGCASGACGGGVVEGGCAGGACGGEAVISEGVVSEGVPTEAAPEAPAAPKT
jgi:hypothetical protein